MLKMKVADSVKRGILLMKFAKLMTTIVLLFHLWFENSKCKSFVALFKNRPNMNFVLFQIQFCGSSTACKTQVN